jgi:hypothetical protein
LAAVMLAIAWLIPLHQRAIQRAPAEQRADALPTASDSSRA